MILVEDRRDVAGRKVGRAKRRAGQEVPKAAGMLLNPLKRTTAILWTSKRRPDVRVVYATATGVLLYAFVVVYVV